MNKKIFLAGLLCLASVASVVGTVGNTNKVEAYTNSSSKVYFIKPDSWTASTVNFMIGHDSYSKGYKMTQVGTSNLYYVNITDQWDDSKYYAIFNTGDAWGGENSTIDHRKQYANNYTNKVSSYNMNYNNYYLATAASGSKGAELTIDWKGASYTSLNVKLTASTNEGGTVSVSGSKLSAVSTLGLNSGATADIAISTSATLTATASAGYEFEGWYDGATRISTNLTHTVNNVTEAKTYTAKFTNLAVKEVNALFAKYYGEGSYTKDSVLNTSKIADNEVAKYFHASADTKYRRTVYTPTGLTMTTSTDGNIYADASTYSNGDNCVTHTGFGGNFTVNEYSSVEDWFVTLHDFVANSGEGWTKEGNVYSHDLVLTTADNEDELTRMAREFVAPMWLAPNAENFAYAQFTKLTVEEVGETLVMKLYVDNGDILVQDSNNVFSQVTIY